MYSRLRLDSLVEPEMAIYTYVGAGESIDRRQNGKLKMQGYIGALKGLDLGSRWRGLDWGRMDHRW